MSSDKMTRLEEKLALVERCYADLEAKLILSLRNNKAIIKCLNEIFVVANNKEDVINVAYQYGLIKDKSGAMNKLLSGKEVI